MTPAPSPRARRGELRQDTARLERPVLERARRGERPSAEGTPERLRREDRRLAREVRILGLPLGFYREILTPRVGRSRCSPDPRRRNRDAHCHRHSHFGRRNRDGRHCAGNPGQHTATLTAETARGTFAEPLQVNTKLANGARVKLKTKWPVELITQRIVAQPWATFGWRSHPGENVNVVLQGTLTLYHDEDGANGVAYSAGSAFPTHPGEVHFARNLSETETLIFFATYFAPKTTPPTAVRVDEPLPALGCPQ